MRELVRGAHDMSRGMAAVRKYPELWKWLVMPAVLSLAILAGVIATIVHFVSPLVAAVERHLPSIVASVAGTLLAILVVAVLAIGGLYIFTTIAGAVAGPFNERLSEGLESRMRGRPAPPFAMGEFLHQAARGAVHAVRRIITAIIGTLVVLALGFVPGIGSLLALVLGFWFASRAAAYDCYDAVLARRNLGYREKLAYLADHRARTFGLGAVTAAMLLVPGLNLVALGFGAAGATVATIEP